MPTTTDLGRRGRKLDVGKACIRFKKLDDLALEIIADLIRRTPTQKFIADYEAALKKPRKRPVARKKPATKPKHSKKTA